MHACWGVGGADLLDVVHDVLLENTHLCKLCWDFDFVIPNSVVCNKTLCEFMITPNVFLVPHLIIFIGDEMVVIVNIFVWKAQLTVALWSSHISRCAPFPCDNSN